MPETPITRKEKYLAKISGETVAIPSPVTREEQYLYKIAVNGGGGSVPDLTNYYTKSETDTKLSEKADLSLFEPMTQEEYEAIPEDERTEPIYLIYEEEEEIDNVSSLSGTNSLNALDTDNISPMSDTMDFKGSYDDTLNDTIENPDTLEFSEPETEISTDEINPVSDLTAQGDETE